MGWSDLELPFRDTLVKTNSYTAVAGDCVLINANGMTTSDTFTVNTGTDVVTFATYNPTDGERFTVASSGSLPTGLVVTTHYYAINSSINTCKFSLTRGGSAVDITATGSGTHTATKISSIFRVPASPSHNDKVVFKLQTAHATRCADIDDNGSSINNGNKLDTQLTLCLAGDLVELTYDSTATSWFVTKENIVRHRAKLRRDASQTINAASITKVELDAEEYDIGGIGDIATNDRFDIRREGKYRIIGIAAMPSAGADRTGLILFYKNLSEINRFGLALSVGSDIQSTTSIGGSTEINLVPGDYIDMRLFHASTAAGSNSTSTNIGLRPEIILTELI